MLDAVNNVMIALTLFMLAVISAGWYVYKGPHVLDKVFGGVLILCGLGLGYIPGTYLVAILGL